MYADLSPDALRKLIDNSPIPLVLSSPALEDCPLVYVNDAFLELTRYSRNEVIGRNCRFLQGPGSEEESRVKFTNAVRHRRQAAIAITNYRKDGSVFRNFVFLQPIFDDSRNFMFILGSQYEISAPKRYLSLIEHAQVLDHHIDLARPELEVYGRFQLLETPIVSVIDIDTVSMTPARNT